MTGRVQLDPAPLEELVSEYAAQHRCPTVAWGVVVEGALVAGAVQDVVYRIASMTKSFSAAATLWLRDRGVLRLDDEIGRHVRSLAGLRSGTDDAPPVTIRDLLTMTSGLTTDDPWADRHLDLTQAEFDEIVAAGPVFAVPTGVQFEYSNFGYAVLGRVVQAAAGRSIQNVVSDELLSPLGMPSTSWTQPVDMVWAPPMEWIEEPDAGDGGGRFGDERAPLGDGLIAPMGGLWTTVADLARWITWLDDAFPARDGADSGPLARATRREMQTVQRYVGMRTARGLRAPTGYGYGLRVLDEPAGTVITHSGGLPGYGSNMRWLRGRRVGVIALSNVTYAPMTELTARLLDLVVEQGFGAAEPTPVSEPMRTLGERLVDVLCAEEWATVAVGEVFADNVEPDMSWERRQVEVGGVITETGRPVTITGWRHVTDADTTVDLADAHGSPLRLTFSVAPARPLRVQEYKLSRISS